MIKKDYYEILDLDKSCHLDDIKSAYRKLAMQFHPDRNKNPGAEEKFKEVSEAYAILSDQKKRSQYDHFGHTGIDSRYSQEDIFRGTDFSSILRDLGFNINIISHFANIFGNIFNQQNSFKQGQNINYNLQIDFKDSYFGKIQQINYQRLEICDSCRGTGSLNGITIPCKYCNGTGNINNSQKTPFGMFVMTVPCFQCNGQGSVIESPCQICNSGKILRNHFVEFKIPPGIQSGIMLRLPGEGNFGDRGDIPGDLFVNVVVKPHHIFKRQNNDIIMDVSVRFSQVALGSSIMVPTLEGKEMLDIAPGTQYGQIYTIKNKGFPNFPNNLGKKGNQLVRIQIEVPTKLSDKQKKILKEFDKI